MVSRKPAVVTRAVRAPVREIRALVASVVPWMNASRSARSAPASATTWWTPSRMPCSGASYVVRTLVENNPSSVSSTTSVNVPPTSAPMRMPMAGPQSSPSTWSSDGKSLGGMMSTVADRCWDSIPPSTLRTSPVM